MILQFAFAKLC